MRAVIPSRRGEESRRSCGGLFDKRWNEDEILRLSPQDDTGKKFAQAA